MLTKSENYKIMISSDLMNFLLKFSSIVACLSELLGTRFIMKESLNSPVGRALANIIAYHNSGRYEERDYELARLDMLVKHLKEIKEHDESLLNYFRRKINRNDVSYYGFRFEVAIASSLIRKKVSFIKRESPDFEILYAGKKIYIETVSVHITSSKLRNLKIKIKNAISRKSRKPYCKPDTALFVDATNIFYHSLVRNQLLLIEELKEYVSGILEDVGFGSIVIFVYVLNKELRRYELNYIRIDNEIIDPTLRIFLDNYYPIKGHEVRDFALCPMG